MNFTDEEIERQRIANERHDLERLREDDETASRKVAEAASAFLDAPVCKAKRGCGLGPDLARLPPERIECVECRCMVEMRDAVDAWEANRAPQRQGTAPDTGEKGNGHE